MQSITLDSYSLHSLTVVQTTMVQSVTGLGFPDIRIDSYPRPGSHGITVAHNLYGGRLITIQGTVRGADAATYLANRQALEAAVGLQLDANNVPVARVLAVTDNAFNMYSVSVVTKSFICEVTSPTVAKWQLQLMATDYVIQSQSQYSTSISLPISGGVLFPLYPFPITFGGSSGGSGVAANAGNAPAYPTILITGPCINPQIYNDSLGAYLSLNLSLIAGDVVTIDCQRRVVYQGTATNRMGALVSGSKFFSLNPGNNNLRFTADAFDVGTATISWRSAFLGI